ncbi:MarR family winged helix-turn-helix transcriptional regulator [Nocardia sp. CDC160]|uniref:MarR family winged helix-turn-helix transcriptional regulator n=1 Tax=Nocardia sp. CDC160 TaxID=3112166 RepID=UPI002DBD4F6A|nr:MarR family winged helix-turn-helix transcriptional regulator [Nocardia sp. CDC160]MEC3916527.1 MarR family winged helix-turn-helix transcriptional regulator [Nocardia sp. CDC160]
MTDDDPAITQPPADIDDGLVDAIAFEIARLTKLRDRTNAQIAALTSGEIEPAAFAILFQLIHCGPKRSGALAEALYSDASTISRQVAGLVKRGLIERRADPTDGRVSVLDVTEAGRAVAAQIRARRNDSLRHMLEDWTPEERDVFSNLLRRFVDGYEVTRQRMLADMAAHKDLQSYYAPAENNS